MYGPVCSLVLLIMMESAESGGTDVIGSRRSSGATRCAIMRHLVDMLQTQVTTIVTFKKTFTTHTLYAMF